MTTEQQDQGNTDQNDDQKQSGEGEPGTTGNEQRDYEGGALGSAGSGGDLKEDKTGSDRGTTNANNEIEDGGDTALSPGIDRDERDYEGGALGSAGSGTGTLSADEAKDA